MKLRVWCVLFLFSVFISCSDDTFSRQELPSKPNPKSISTDIGRKKNPDFIPDTQIYALSSTQTLSYQEVDSRTVLVYGNSQFVTSAVGGGYGIIDQNSRNLTAYLIKTFGDHFHVIIVFHTFPDLAQISSAAYYSSIFNDTEGIGIEMMNGREGWGSNPVTGMLDGYVNMNNLDRYGDSIDNLSPSVYSVLGQEITHRFLAFLTYKDAQGNISEKMLGRDGSHWSVPLQSYGSVMDGILYEEVSETEFMVMGRENNFSPLDEYAMGLREPKDVESWFYINGAKANGSDVGPQTYLNKGVIVTGEKETITIDQVIAVHGLRTPASYEQKWPQALGVLLSEPGQKKEEVQSFVTLVQHVFKELPKYYHEWSEKRGSLCIQTRGICDRPKPVFQWDLEQILKNSVDLNVSYPVDIGLKNAGTGTIANAKVILEAIDTDYTKIGKHQILFTSVKKNETVSTDTPFTFLISEESACGNTQYFSVEIEHDGPLIQQEAVSFRIGSNVFYTNNFSDDNGWIINPDGNDSAASGAWEYGLAEQTEASGIIFQPGSKRNVFATGIKGGNIAENDFDGGITTLQSPAIKTEQNLLNPTIQLSVYHTALDLSTGGGGIESLDDTLEIQIAKSMPFGFPMKFITITIINGGKGRWYFPRFRLKDYLENINEGFVLRFVVRHNFGSAIVESQLSLIEIEDLSGACREAFYVKHPELRPKEIHDGGSIFHDDIDDDSVTSTHTGTVSDNAGHDFSDQKKVRSKNSGCGCDTAIVADQKHNIELAALDFVLAVFFVLSYFLRQRRSQR